MPGMNSETPVQETATTQTNQAAPQTPQEEPQVEREITLTDKLNRKLLQSFLQRINTDTGPFSNLQENNSDNSSNTDEFDDFS